MKQIVYCGFGKLGRDCLERLINEGYNVSYVFTHKELNDHSVDTFAIENNINYTYKDARKHLDETKEKVAELSPQYLISVNYRFIIPKAIFGIANYAINIHGSLLPQYRGRTPHVWSIINGEEYSGITSHLIEETVDTGDIIEQIKIKIEPLDTGYTLLKKFEKLYPDLLIQSLNKVEINKLTKQNEYEASYFGMRTPDMGYIDFLKNAADVINFVRAQANPYPGAYYYLNDGNKIIINRLEVEEKPIPADLAIGRIVKVNNKYYVRCRDRVLKVVDYQIC